MEIKKEVRGIDADKVRKFCAETVGSVEETMNFLRTLGGLGETEALLNRLGQLKTGAEKLRVAGEVLAKEWERKDAIAAAYSKLQV